MTELMSDLSTPGDAALIARVRGGDVAAYGELFDRHRLAAGRLARQLVPGPDSDDLVSEAFVKVLKVLQDGGGPDIAFRAYLLTAVRRLHIDRVRNARRAQPTDDLEQYDAGIPFQDTAVDGFERSVAARAFASLPERWQLVLWHLEVEGQRPADVAPLLGVSPNSVSALGYRAREGLRQAYLQMHLADTTGERCRWTTEHLGGYVRAGLARRDAARVEHHLEECRRCTGLYLELVEVNSNLRGLLAPLLLGTLAPGYLAAVSAASTAAGAGTALGVGALLDRLTDGIKALSPQAAIGGVVAGAVVTSGLVGLGYLQDEAPGRPQSAPEAALATPRVPPALDPTTGPSKLPEPTEPTEPAEPAEPTEPAEPLRSAPPMSPRPPAPPGSTDPPDSPAAGSSARGSEPSAQAGAGEGTSSSAAGGRRQRAAGAGPSPGRTSSPQGAAPSGGSRSPSAGPPATTSGPPRQESDPPFTAEPRENDRPPSEAPEPPVPTPAPAPGPAPAPRPDATLTVGGNVRVVATSKIITAGLTVADAPAAGGVRVEVSLTALQWLGPRPAGCRAARTKVVCARLDTPTTLELRFKSTDRQRPGSASFRATARAPGGAIAACGWSWGSVSCR